MQHSGLGRYFNISRLLRLCKPPSPFPKQPGPGGLNVHIISSIHTSPWAVSFVLWLLKSQPRVPDQIFSLKSKFPCFCQLDYGNWHDFLTGFVGFFSWLNLKNTWLIFSDHIFFACSQPRAARTKPNTFYSCPHIQSRTVFTALAHLPYTTESAQLGLLQLISISASHFSYFREPVSVVERLLSQFIKCFT